VDEPKPGDFWGECPLDPGPYGEAPRVRPRTESSTRAIRDSILFAGLSPIEDSTRQLAGLHARVFATPGLAAPVTALFDVMALHTYRSEQDVADAQTSPPPRGTDVDLARAFLRRRGAEDKPTWVTEWGWRTASRSRTRSTSHRRRAGNRAAGHLDALRDHYVPVVIFHRSSTSWTRRSSRPGTGVLTTSYRRTRLLLLPPQSVASRILPVAAEPISRGCSPG